MRFTLWKMLRIFLGLKERFIIIIDLVTLFFYFKLRSPNHQPVGWYIIMYTIWSWVVNIIFLRVFWILAWFMHRHCLMGSFLSLQIYRPISRSGLSKQLTCTWKRLIGKFYIIVVSRPSYVRSKIQKHHANGNLICFRVMFLDFCSFDFRRWYHNYNIEGLSNIEVLLQHKNLYAKNFM